MRSVISQRQQWPDRFAERAPKKSIRDLMDTNDLYHNALAHWDNATSEEREQGGQWYPTAREYVKNISDATNRDYSRSAAVMAALSPRVNWDQNMTSGTHFLLNYNPQHPEYYSGSYYGSGSRVAGAGNQCS